MEESALFIAITAVGLISGYYLFYMCSIALAGYVLLRIFVGKRIKERMEVIASFGRLICGYLLGACLAGPWLLPAALRLFASNRLDASKQEGNLWFAGFSMLKKIWYRLFMPYMPGSDNLYLNFSVIVIPMLVLLFSSKWRKHLKLKIALLMQLLVLMIPFGGLIMALIAVLLILAENEPALLRCFNGIFKGSAVE